MAIVDAWLAVCSQWCTAGLADGRVLWHGLNYSGADVSLTRSAISLSPEQWSCLRLMERTAASVLNGNRG